LVKSRKIFLLSIISWLRPRWSPSNICKTCTDLKT